MAESDKECDGGERFAIEKIKLVVQLAGRNVPFCPKKRRLGEEKTRVAKEETTKLLEVCFIMEL
ncbi:hypothetical protein CR513_42964, partial [Mucuna pruriens]